MKKKASTVKLFEANGAFLKQLSLFSFYVIFHFYI